MTGPVALDPGRWLLGCAALATAGAALAWAAVGVRAALVPGWRGSPARLAEVVTGLALLSAAAQAVGGVGAFRPLPVLAAVVLTGVAAGAGARRWPRRRQGEPGPPAPDADPGGGDPAADQAAGGWGSRTEVLVAVPAVVLVALGWVTHAAEAWRRGMTEGDTLWYHATFALRFVQLERLWVFPGIGAPVQDPFPANAQLLHALAFLPFDRDVLSPLVNLGFGALVLLAASVIGRTRDAGALALGGAALVMGLPTIAGTQPGQATNDVVCGALLLSAVAVLLHAAPTPGAAAVAGAAAGMALASKLTVTVPVAVLTVGMVVLAVRERRAGLAAAWVAAATPFPAFWFARNWDLAGNPLPWYDLAIGPWHLRRTVVMVSAESIADFLPRFGTARHLWAAGLGNAFGRAWPVVLVLVLGGTAIAFLPGRRPTERLAGLAAAGAVVGYVTTPYTMMFAGGLFQDTIRYSFAVLLLGVTLAALGAAGAGPGWRTAFLATAVAVVALNLGAPRTERLAPFVPGRLPVVLAVLAVAAVLAVTLWGGRRRAVPGRVRWPLALVGVATVVAVVGGGYLLQRAYLRHRYVDAGLPLDEANAHLGPVRGQRLAVLGTLHFSPLLGASAGNVVRYVDGPAGGRNTCDGWRRALGRAPADFVVVGEGGAFFFNPRPAWFDDHPSLRRVAGGPGGTLYRVGGPLAVRCGSRAATSR